MQSTISGLQSQVAALNTTIANQAAVIDTLTIDIAAIQTSGVMALDPYVDLVWVPEPSKPAVTYPTARFTGINVQIVNKSPYASNIGTNGLGNLILGYNKIDEFALPFCSDGYYNSDQATCEAQGGVWASSQHTGSHNLIIGESNAYTQTGGLVAGLNNIINADFASVSGGRKNTASGITSSVSGGSLNIASGVVSAVSGGVANTASGFESSVSGGVQNTASGQYASVTGGLNNVASGFQAVVSGGAENLASNDSSSVSGGIYNTAGGSGSPFQGASVSGGSYNVAGGRSSSVSGGSNRTVTGTDDWQAGSLFQDF